MKLYFLFGEEASGVLNDEGVEVLKEMHDDISFDLFVWDKVKSTPLELLEAFNGWG